MGVKGIRKAAKEVRYLLDRYLQSCVKTVLLSSENQPQTVLLSTPKLHYSTIFRTSILETWQAGIMFYTTLNVQRNCEMVIQLEEGSEYRTFSFLLAHSLEYDGPYQRVAGEGGSGGQSCANLEKLREEKTQFTLISSFMRPTFFLFLFQSRRSSPVSWSGWSAPSSLPPSTNMCNQEDKYSFVETVRRKFVSLRRRRRQRSEASKYQEEEYSVV